jgi:hypothetical protein
MLAWGIAGREVDQNWGLRSSSAEGVVPAVANEISCLPTIGNPEESLVGPRPSLDGQPAHCWEDHFARGRWRRPSGVARGLVRDLNGFPLPVRDVLSSSFPGQREVFVLILEGAWPAH